MLRLSGRAEGEKPRVFYALGGPGDIIRAHRNWRKQAPDDREMSVTFSSQIAEFCQDNASSAYFVSPHPEPRRLVDGDFVLEHRAKRSQSASGLLYHLEEFWYGCGLLRAAIQFRADTVLLDSGSTSHSAMLLFKLCGFQVIPILHSALWPAGHRPTGMKATAKLGASRLFFQHGADRLIGVSPECLRQVEELTNGQAPPSFFARAQFFPHAFQDIAPPPPHSSPFLALYVGRVERNKGVFDILDAAAQLEAEAPGRFKFEIWGEGDAAEELREAIAQRGLEDVVKAPGYLLPNEAVAARERSHVGLVPTQNSCPEGMAMTAIESILAERPLVASSVVPATEVLAPATSVCRPNSAADIADALKGLAASPDKYAAMVAACASLKTAFLDSRYGLEKALSHAMSGDEADAKITLRSRSRRTAASAAPSLGITSPGPSHPTAQSGSTPQSDSTVQSDSDDLPLDS